MNVFRSRKKSISEADVAKRPSLDEAPPLPKATRGLFGRKKAVIEEKKPELDLGSVLPSDNEFRTSLIMPNLSQRFSMLREQDDPLSKLGKASDDSVLFPKRHSRLNLFEGSLDDIAEVSSIAGSFKPPFAQEDKAGYASDGGYDSDGGGSIMSRAKPGQGNKFFGGRQKVYKIPAAGALSKHSSRPGSAGRERGMGKAVYEDDISTSLWQKLRQEERSKKSLDFDLNDVSGDGRSSPSYSRYNRNRETSSSTNSNERNSTAATSMTSTADNSQGSMIKEQARDRPFNKRLYGQNIDQQMHDQQTSAMQRLNSVRNARGGFQSLAPARAPSGGSRPGALSSASSLRSGSPSPALGPSNGFDFGLGSEKQPSLLNTRDVDSGYQGSPTFTPPISPAADPTLVAHMDPNDHGKATASGAFQKPKARYDEQQFAQRQLQLQEGRETPVPSGSRSETPNDLAHGRTRQGSDTSASTSRQPFGGSFTTSSIGREFSQDRNMSKRITGQALNGAFLAELSDSEDDTRQVSKQNLSSSFYGSGANQEQSASYGQSNLILAQEEIHPALRIPVEDHQAPKQSTQALSYQLPPLGETPGGLSAMVRGHLRNVSDASSVYPDSPPPERATLDSPLHDHIDEEQEEPPSPEAALADRAKAMLDNARRARADSVTHAGGSRSISPPTKQLHQQPSIDELVRKVHHARGPSTETQQERDAFADELADRRRQVEEKLRNIAESRRQTDETGDFSRDPSPGKPLQKKSSRGSLADGPGAMAKFKKFIPSSTSGSGSTTPISQPDSPPAQSNPAGQPSEVELRDRVAGSSRAAGKGSMRDRDFGAERRARHAECVKSPRGNGVAPPRGRVDARKQQFAGASGTLTSDFTERVNANPDQGKPHFHPAGRARHYSPPRANQTPDQKPLFQPQPTGRTPSRGPVNKGQIGRPGQPLDQNHLARQPSADRAKAMTPPNARGRSPANVSKRMNSPPNGGVQMITPGTFPPPVGSPSAQSPSGELRYVSARKRSVSKAEISNPTFLSGTYDTRSVVDLPPGASLENGMAEVRARDAAVSPPPVPPINPRRRAMGAIKGLTRSSTDSPEGEGGSRGGSPVALRRQMSEGTSLRTGGSPVKGY